MSLLQWLHCTGHDWWICISSVSLSHCCCCTIVLWWSWYQQPMHLIIPGHKNIECGKSNKYSCFWTSHMSQILTDTKPDLLLFFLRRTLILTALFWTTVLIWIELLYFWWPKNSIDQGSGVPSPIPHYTCMNYVSVRFLNTTRWGSYQWSIVCYALFSMREVYYHIEAYIGKPYYNFTRNLYIVYVTHWVSNILTTL